MRRCPLKLVLPLFAFISLSVTAQLSRVVSSSSAAANGKIQIAFVGSFSSTSPHIALTDHEVARGLEAYVRTHPEFAQKIEIVRFDNKGEPELGIGIADELAAKQIKFAVGVTKSKQALVFANALKPKNVLLITPFATNDMVTEGFPLVFRTCFSDREQGKALASFATNQLDVKRVVIIENVEDPYSTGLSATFRSLLKPGVEVKIVKVLSGQVRFDAAAQKEIVDYKPDTLFLPLYVDQTASVIDLFQPQLPNNVRYLGGDGFSAKLIADNVLKRAAGLQLFSVTHWHAEIKTKANREFMANFKKVYPNEPPVHGSAMMYDLAGILHQAFKRSQWKEDPAAVATALRALKFQSTLGPLSFTNPIDNTPSKPVVIVRHRDGQGLLERLVETP
jgi:branched-chain amino acid transport system substrate-binding protein